MKKILLIVIFFALTRVYGQVPPVSLIPQPVEIQQSGGTLQLTKASSISYSSQESRKIAEMLVRKLNIVTGFSLKTQQSTTGSVQFNLNNVPDARLGKEGYTLISSPEGVIIAANEPAGLFYGMQTLLQLLPKEIESKNLVEMNWTIPCIKITDYPRFGWRGIMLDVSRNFFSKEEVKLYIDQIARFKI
jgi:hexosaminidase